MKRLALLPLLVLPLAACGGGTTAAKTTTVTQTSTTTSTETETETATSDPTDSSTSDTATDTSSDTATDTSTSDTSSDEASSDTSSAEATSAAGGGQVDAAVSSARSYLDTQAFSKQGLIDQLSSAYGEKYPVAVATQAVDSLTDVDWNAQAVKAAQNYLTTQSFSCAGLTDQLSSSYGEKFTPSQAAYGASQTSVCK